MLSNRFEKIFIFIVLILVIALITTGCNLPSDDSNDAAQPLILSVLPGNGAIAVRLDTTISIEFSESMNQGSVEHALSLNPGNLPLDFTWNGNGKQLNVRPVETLTQDPVAEYYDRAMVYTLTILQTAKGVNGIKLGKNYSTSFTTQTYPQVIAGNNYSMCLSYDGNICGWGNNSSGQLLCVPTVPYGVGV